MTRYVYELGTKSGSVSVTDECLEIVLKSFCSQCNGWLPGHDVPDIVLSDFELHLEPLTIEERLDLRLISKEMLGHISFEQSTSLLRLGKVFFLDKSDQIDHYVFMGTDTLNLHSNRYFEKTKCSECGQLWISPDLGEECFYLDEDIPHDGSVSVNQYGELVVSKDILLNIPKVLRHSVRVDKVLVKC